MSNDPDLQEMVYALEERVRILEEKMSRLEGTGTPVASASSNTEVLLEAIRRVLAEASEADVATIRQKIVKGGLECNKSDINKALYANQSVFKITRTDGLKPVWSLVQN